MSFMRQTCSQLCIALAVVSAARADAYTLTDVQAMLSGYEVVRGDFVQIRHMTLFAAPLESSGQFALAERHGVYWRQSAPFEVVLIATDARFLQQVAGGDPEIATPADNPAMFHFIRLMRSLLGGDTAAVEHQFELSFSDAGTHWRLALTPRAAPLNTVFREITVQGRAYIDEVTLVEVEGDRIEIRFSNQRSAPAELTEDEADAFSR